MENLSAIGEFSKVIDLFIEIIKGLKNKTISLETPLEEMVIRQSGDDLAYIDNRKKAWDEYGYDFWKGIDQKRLKDQNLGDKVLYSSSQEFPDFVFKIRKNKNIMGGSLLELKDSKGGVISSFNSTIPTKKKSLEEIDIINNSNLVSKIAKIKDGEFSNHPDYFKFERRCFYLIRTFRENNDRVKLSIIDGSFFETISKKELVSKIFQNILRDHIEQRELTIANEMQEKVEAILSNLTNQSLIACSQTIEGASIKPRLRLMAEVNQEGNPHNDTNYPEIIGGSFNLILEENSQVAELKIILTARIPELRVFSLQHKKDGKFIVFQFNTINGLDPFLK